MSDDKWYFIAMSILGASAALGFGIHAIAAAIGRCS